MQLDHRHFSFTAPDCFLHFWQVFSLFCKNSEATRKCASVQLWSQGLIFRFHNRFCKVLWFIIHRHQMHLFRDWMFSGVAWSFYPLHSHTAHVFKTTSHSRPDTQTKKRRSTINAIVSRWNRLPLLDVLFIPAMISFSSFFFPVRKLKHKVWGLTQRGNTSTVSGFTTSRVGDTVSDTRGGFPVVVTEEEL